MKLFDLLKNIDCSFPKQKENIEITDICFDSRKVKDGSLFICIDGTMEDGHKYAKSAIESGAAALVVTKVQEFDAIQVLVEDSREAIFTIASQFYGNPHKDLKFIGVTGTNGKTSTTIYIKHILETLGKKVGLFGTITNMIGSKKLRSSFSTPEPVSFFKVLKQMKDENVDYVVMEVSSQAISQKRVCKIDFEVGVFTNLTRDHLDYHKTMENYKNTKAELFKQSKISILNADDEVSDEYRKISKGKTITYSIKQNSADYLGKDLKLSIDKTSFIVVTLGNISRTEVSTPGNFAVYNALAAISSICALGYDLNKVTDAMKNAPAPEGRAEVIKSEKGFAVMIDYAHTPDGLQNILDTINSFINGRLITVVGCGGDRDKKKRPMMGEIAADNSDFVIVTSDNPRSEDPMKIIDSILKGVKKHEVEYKVIENRQDAIKFAIDMAEDGDIILLGGKGHEKYQILKTGKIDFDEVKIVKNFLVKQ